MDLRAELDEMAQDPSLTTSGLIFWEGGGLCSEILIFNTFIPRQIWIGR